MDIAGTAVLTSAPSNAPAKVLPGEDFPAYTGRLLKLLRNGVPDGPELLTIPILHRRLYRELKAASLRPPLANQGALVNQLGLVTNRAWQAEPAAATFLASSTVKDDRAQDRTEPVQPAPSVADFRQVATPVITPTPPVGVGLATYVASAASYSLANRVVKVPVSESVNTAVIVLAGVVSWVIHRRRPVGARKPYQPHETFRPRRTG